MNPPDWDLEQLEVIIDNPSSWQLVAAGPGAGKSAVACQRIAFLIDEGVPASRILLISFTRTAVAELRDRIVSYAVAGEQARKVRISTIDSHAWELRAGFDDAILRKTLGKDSYDVGIERTTELLRSANPELIEFLGALEHVIIDEAQDVMNVRAELIIDFLRMLSSSCGVTILADPAQAIYGFTTDELGDNDDGLSLLQRLEQDSPRPLVHRVLKQNHRVKNTELTEMFLRARKEIELAETTAGHVHRVQEAIRQACGNDVGVSSYSSTAELLSRSATASTLVLYRRRADVLFASSYCSQRGVEHRLRMSETPVVVKPWLGWLFGETTQSFIEREDFNALWQSRHLISAEPFRGVDRDTAWGLLHRHAAGHWRESVDLEQLRRIIARPRPPIEFCEPDLGCQGPILGTIHASKGREADTVVLVMPSIRHSESDADPATDDAETFEEGRVYYVGATRARKMLIAAACTAPQVGYLESKRVYRIIKNHQAQLEIGRAGDVDPLAHLGWATGRDVQRGLANCVGTTFAIHARASEENEYARRLVLNRCDADGVTRPMEIGQLSQAFDHDLKRLWSRMDPGGRLRPTQLIPYLYLIGVTTVGIAEDARWAVKHPFSQSGMALAPVVKGFSPIQFLARAHRGVRE